MTDQTTSSITTITDLPLSNRGSSLLSSGSDASYDGTHVLVQKLSKATMQENRGKNKRLLALFLIISLLFFACFSTGGAVWLRSPSFVKRDKILSVRLFELESEMDSMLGIIDNI